MRDYLRLLKLKIADGVQLAINHLVPARIGWGVGQVPEFVFKSQMEDEARNHCAQSPGGIRSGRDAPTGRQSRPAGTGRSGRPGRFICCGPVAGRSTDRSPRQLFAALRGSAGGPRFRRLLRRPSPITWSACWRSGVRIRRSWEYSPTVRGGDVGWRTSGGPCPRRTGIIGWIGSPQSWPPEVFRVHQTLEYQDWVSLDVINAELELGVRLPSPDEVERAQRIVDRTEYPIKISPGNRNQALKQYFALETTLLSQYPETLTRPLQVVRMGDLAILAIPNEVFAETGLELKQKSPFGSTFTISPGGRKKLSSPAQTPSAGRLRDLAGRAQLSGSPSRAQGRRQVARDARNLEVSTE